MITLHAGDCLEVMQTLDADSIDACVCDPPYGIAFMGRKWDSLDNIAFRPETWVEVWRVLKPGAHLIAFGGTRTYHRMACAIEDAGFEVRDQLAWMYGSGFPKSHDISKAIDKAAGAERERVRHKPRPASSGTMAGSSDTRPWIEASQKLGYHECAGNDPITEEAKQWNGWGTSLKPAWEPIVLARKPLSERTVAANVLRHGCGGLNIDACRVGEEVRVNNPGSTRPRNSMGNGWRDDARPTIAIGRWPANVAHDGSDEVLAEFAKYGESKSTQGKPRKGKPGDGWGMAYTGAEYSDTGTPARFFYKAKAGNADRAGSKHPTVKPVALMTWLCSLVTPPGGTVLDPFAGSGTTGAACKSLGFDAVLIEREAEYVDDIKRRLDL